MSVPIIYGAGIPHVTVPHFMALYEEAPKHAKISQFSTYKGHSPTPDRAWDIFPLNGSFEEGDKLARWLVRPEVMELFGIDYRIWSFNRRVGSIFNPEVAPYEREMVDRGSKTANHVDHNHVSANATAAARPQPQPKDEEEMTPEQWKELVGERIDKIVLPTLQHFQDIFSTWEPIILGLDDEANVSDEQIDRMATALSDRLGADVAAKLAERLANG